MRFTRTLLLAATVTAAVGVTAAPALAAPSDSTTVTFEVAVGTLDIDTPTSADLGAGDAGATIEGSLGPVTVSDGRASSDASWEATVTSTVFSSGGGSPTQTILAEEVEYWSGPATATTGTGTFTPGQLTALDAEPLDTTTPLVAFTHSGGTGNNTATWEPTLIVNVPLDSEAGTYTGTVTHSVA